MCYWIKRCLTKISIAQQGIHQHICQLICFWGFLFYPLTINFTIKPFFISINFKINFVVYKEAASNKEENNYAKAIGIAYNTVVEINCTVETSVASDFFFFQGGTQISQSSGSGVIISDDGYIVTNNHVIESAKTVSIKLYNGENYEAEEDEVKAPEGETEEANESLIQEALEELIGMLHEAKDLKLIQARIKEKLEKLKFPFSNFSPKELSVLYFICNASVW